MPVAIAFTLSNKQVGAAKRPHGPEYGVGEGHQTALSGTGRHRGEPQSGPTTSGRCKSRSALSPLRVGSAGQSVGRILTADGRTEEMADGQYNHLLSRETVVEHRRRALL